MAGLLQLIFAIAFIALACVFTYKATLPLCLKIIDLCFVSFYFRMGICIFLALAFFAVGILQLRDFFKEPNPGLALFFPLSFLVTGIFLFLGLRKPNK